jgi:precorrin-6B methylase 2
MKQPKLGCLLISLLFAPLLGGCVGKNYGDESFRLTIASHGKDVMWVPTREKLVTEMLSAAKVSANDIVYDLGSGDGIIPIEAAKQFKVRAVGIEYNADLVQLSIRNAKRAGVENLVNLKKGDIFLEDFSEATVLMLYLGENLNLKLKPKILKMRPGTRVVSNTFRMGTWVPDSIIKPTSDETAYLWIVPADVNGEWELQGLFESSIAKLKITQKKQFFDGEIHRSGKKPIRFENGRINGSSVNFEFQDDYGNRQRFSGNFENYALFGKLNEDSRLRITGKRIIN